MRSPQPVVKRPHYHLLSIKTKRTPCWVLMAWFGFWCTPCAKEVAVLRFSLCPCVTLWYNKIILYQYKDQVLGLGGKRLYLPTEPCYQLASFLSLSYFIMFIETLIDIGYAFK